MSDNTKIAIFALVIMLLLYSKKLTEVVTAKVGGVPVTNLGSNDFDYSVCGIAPQIAQNGLPIMVCIDPQTSQEYPIQEYPNGGNSAQVIFLRDNTQIARSILLNTPSSSGRIYGPKAPSALDAMTAADLIDPITGLFSGAL